MFPSVGNFPSSAWPYSQPTPSLRYPFGHNASTPTSSSTTSTPTASSKPNSYGSSTSDQNSRFPRVPDVSTLITAIPRYLSYLCPPCIRSLYQYHPKQQVNVNIHHVMIQNCAKFVIQESIGLSIRSSHGHLSSNAKSQFPLKPRVQFFDRTRQIYGF